MKTKKQKSNKKCWGVLIIIFGILFLMGISLITESRCKEEVIGECSNKCYSDYLCILSCLEENEIYYSLTKYELVEWIESDDYSNQTIWSEIILEYINTPKEDGNVYIVGQDLVYKIN